ncbi:MAG: hypothetical protein ACR2QO_17190 [Acidimicrobiales bacterium]
MERSGDVTLTDELTGETITTTGGVAVAKLIEDRLVDVDHPRFDFRGQPLEFRLIGSDDAELPADKMVAPGSRVRLTSPDAGEVLARRNRWLGDVTSDEAGAASVARGTQLALVERTQSRLDDVARLRAELTANRPPPPRRRSRIRLGGALLTVVVLLIVGAIFTAWGWWFIQDLDTGGARGRGGGQPVATMVVPQPDLAVEEPAIAVGPGGFPQQGCGELEIEDFEPPGEVEVEVTCEIAILEVATDETGTVLAVTASSGRGDPIVWVYDEDGDELGFNDDTPGGLNSYLEVEVGAGRHEVHVGNLTGESSVINIAIELN